jgi:hypothetical protein
MLPVAKTAVLWARRHAIPSLHLLHGVALARPYTVHEQLTADVLAVFGPRSAEGYLDLGLAPDRIKFTGNPAWDNYPAIMPQRDHLRRQLVQKYGLNPQWPIVVFATTWAANLTAVADEQIYGRSITAFLTVVQRLRQQGIQLNAVIKDRAANRDLGLERINQLLVAQGVTQDMVYAIEDAEAWVVASDAMIGVDSNILVEAMMVGTPAINLLTDAIAAFVAGSALPPADQRNPAGAGTALQHRRGWPSGCTGGGTDAGNCEQQAKPAEILVATVPGCL